MEKQTECTCYSEYPNPHEKRKNGKWKCVDCYKCVHPIEYRTTPTGYKRVWRKTKCIKEAEEGDLMYKGSNAEKLHNMCLYDLLCRMQKNGSDCVIELITGTPQGKRCEKHESGWVVDCRSCIAAWLNERSE